MIEAAVPTRFTPRPPRRSAPRPSSCPARTCPWPWTRASRRRRVLRTTPAWRASRAASRSRQTWPRVRAGGRGACVRQRSCRGRRIRCYKRTCLALLARVGLFLRLVVLVVVEAGELIAKVLARLVVLDLLFLRGGPLGCRLGLRLLLRGAVLLGRAPALLGLGLLIVLVHRVVLVLLQRRRVSTPTQTF